MITVPHPVENESTEVQFFADIDKLANNLRQYEANDEKLCDIEASATWYAKNRRETPVDRGLSKVTEYFKELDLLEVPSDKGNMFCIMRKSTYQTKLDQVHDCPQFSRIDASDDIKKN